MADVSVELMEPMLPTPPQAPALLAGAAVRPRPERTAWAVLAALVAITVSYAVHAFVPNGQEIILSSLKKLPPSQHPFVVLLQVLAGVVAVSAVIAWLWRPLRPWVGHYAPLLAGAVVALTAWELITVKGNWLEQPYFPGPDEVFAGLVEDRWFLLDSAWHSLILLVSGYVAGVVMGVTSGVLIGWFPRVRYWGMPVLKIIGPIPATALIPLVMMISRQTYPCAVALIGFAVWFPVTMLTASGIANVRLSYLDVARTLGAGRA
jgi:NitT/TauT family transport system permease protein